MRQTFTFVLKKNIRDCKSFILIIGYNPKIRILINDTLNYRLHFTNLRLICFTSIKNFYFYFFEQLVQKCDLQYFYLYWKRCCSFKYKTKESRY